MEMQKKAMSGKMLFLMVSMISILCIVIVQANLEAEISAEDSKIDSKVSADKVSDFLTPVSADVYLNPKKTYDDSVKSAGYGKMTFENLGGIGGKLAEISINSNTCDSPISCQTIGTTVLHKKAQLFTDIKAVDYKSRDTNAPRIRIYVYLEKNISKSVDTYSSSCASVTPQNGTTYQNCSTVKNGTITTYSMQEFKVPYNYEALPAGTWKWSIEGNRPANFIADIIPWAFNVEMREYFWWNETWKKKIAITPNHASIPSNYSWRFMINVTTEMNGTLNDLRLINTDMNETLPLWIESYNSSYAIIWTKIHNNNTIHLFFNNTLAQSVSNRSAVMYYFNDFDSGSVSDFFTGVTASWSISGGNLVHPSRNGDTGQTYNIVSRFQVPAGGNLTVDWDAHPANNNGAGLLYLWWKSNTSSPNLYGYYYTLCEESCSGSSLVRAEDYTGAFIDPTGIFIENVNGGANMGNSLNHFQVKINSTHNALGWDSSDSGVKGIVTPTPRMLYTNAHLNANLSAPSWFALVATWTKQNWYTDYIQYRVSLDTDTRALFGAEESYALPDSIAPNATIVYPVNSTYNVNVSQLNYIRSEDAAYCHYSRDNGKTNSTPSFTCSNFTNILSIQGSNNWTLFANDTAGNLNISTVFFVVDTVPASIDFGAGTETAGAVLARSWATANITMSDATTGVQSSTLKLYNASGSLVYQANGTGTTLFSNFTGLSTGLYFVNGTVLDNAGNINNSATRNFSIDLSAPSIIIEANDAEYGRAFNELPIQIGMSGDAFDSNIDQRWFSVLNSTGGYAIANTTTSGGAFSITLNAFDTYTVFYSANDTAGNIGISYVTVKITKIGGSGTGTYNGMNGIVSISGQQNLTASNTQNVEGKNTQKLNEFISDFFTRYGFLVIMAFIGVVAFTGKKKRR